jgi:hypothetical protein
MVQKVIEVEAQTEMIKHKNVFPMAKRKQALEILPKP